MNLIIKNNRNYEMNKNMILNLTNAAFKAVFVMPVINEERFEERERSGEARLK